LNFEDEHYVRIYTRDSKTWLRWGWEGQAVFMFLTRKVDKAGVLDEIESPTEDIALMTGLPAAIVEAGLPRLLKSGTVEIIGTTLVIPNYLPAQTVSKSDKLRAQDCRSRRSATARLAKVLPKQSVTNRDDGVTDDDEANAGGQAGGKEGEVTDSDGAVTGRDASPTERDEMSADAALTSPNAVQRRSVQRSAEEVDPRPQGPTRPRGWTPNGLDESLELAIQERAQILVDNPHARWMQAHKWPEIVAFAEGISTALGWHRPRLTSPDLPALKKLVELHAAFTADELLEAIEAAPGDSWLREKAKGLGSLSVQVVGNLLNGRQRPPASSPSAGPGAAKTETDEAREQRRRIQAERDEAYRQKKREEAIANGDLLPNGDVPSGFSMKALLKGVG
jgi:hypothetical protein